MHTSTQQEKEFLMKWMKGLQICCSSKKQINLMERKKKIKLSADIAMASAKTTPTSWSNSLLSDARKSKEGMILVENLLGVKPQLKHLKGAERLIGFHKRVRCKKILKRSRRVKRMDKKLELPRSNLAAVIANRLVKKRTKVLKSLVPGGESMDEFSLIKEAMDYIISLKVQVDVMRSVVAATEVLSDDILLKSAEKRKHA